MDCNLIGSYPGPAFGRIRILFFRVIFQLFSFLGGRIWITLFFECRIRIRNIVLKRTQRWQRLQDVHTLHKDSHYLEG